MTPERAERRAHPRMHLVAKVEVEAQGRTFVAVVRNVSAGGMQIYTAHPAAVGERLQLVFGLPDRDDIYRATGVVRNVLPNSAMGVQFEKIDPAVAAAIRSFVDKTHPPDK